ncbi:protein phosphatase 1 regulatory subunit 3A [Pteropus vampyrus]|uniref:Protein phosphatase 1 regulatory subunit 3A n=1 Tax=Pteropus vampyrus TaxID=132908 RepID=A0A6P6D1T1_PTEVA|nr:protein phosphatase 1 regulatory subunit 3A [Pteropus vampyrus]
MEPSEEPSQINKDNFLEVPNLSDSLSEDEDIKATFKPGFSPQPSRRGSDSSEDMYLDTPSSGTRRVSFADAFGFNLVSVKEFDCWDLPSISTNFDLRKDIFHTEEYVLSPLFDLPSPEDLLKVTLSLVFNKEESSVTSYENNFENSKITDTYIPKIICSHEEKEDLETCNQNVKDANKEHDEHNEKELELMIKQHLIRSTVSRDEKNTFSMDPVNFPNKAERLEKKHIHDEVHTDLFKRTLSPSLSAESSLKGSFPGNEKYSTEKEYSHQPSEEITSCMRKRKSPLRNTSSDELVQLHISNKEVLDDNANPAQRRGRVQITCPSSDQLMADNLNTKHEGGVKKIKIKDWKCLKRDFHSDFHSEESIEKESSKKDYGNGKNEKEKQRIHLGDNEKQSKNFQSILHDQKKARHSEISVEGVGASNRELTVLLSKDTTTSNQAIRADLFHSPKKNLNLEEAVLTIPEPDLLTTKGTTLEGMTGQVHSPRNGNVLRNEYLFQVGEGNLDWVNPEDQNMSTQHKQCQNFLEIQGKVRESKTNITEQIKEQADYEDIWGGKSNKSLKVSPTEELFTCQETVSCELSSLANHGITEKAEADTAYIIKTTSESTLESMSTREKTVIAKLPQETAQSDRPIEVKETAFDPHEGRNDDSHYTLCQGDAVGVICDNDFEKKSCLGICNVHADEMKKKETISVYNPGNLHDRKKLRIGDITSAEESFQFITGNEKVASNLDLHFRMLPTDKKIFPENRDHGQVQELSKETSIDAITHSALNADTNRVPGNGSHVSDHHAKTSVSSYEQSIAVENSITTMILQSIPTKSGYNYNPASDIQGIEKNLYSGSILEEVPKSSGSRRERCIGQIFQQEESNVEKSLGPTILISETIENMDKNEELINSGQSLCFSGDKESENSATANLSAQESQAQSSESLLLKYANSKIPYFLLFLIFLITIYQYDLMIGLAFYLFSLYWLSWEGGRQKEPVKKK